jgi:hypothetical protein
MLVLTLYTSGSAMFEKLPATLRMLWKLRGFHRGTPHSLGSSLLQSYEVSVTYYLSCISMFLVWRKVMKLQERRLIAEVQL